MVFIKLDRPWTISSIPLPLNFKATAQKLDVPLIAQGKDHHITVDVKLRAVKVSLSGPA